MKKLRLPKRTSPLEKAFELAMQTWHPAMLQGMEREYLFARDLGRRFRADFCWPIEMLIVECDGGQWAPGGGRHNTDRDREKLNIAAQLGYKVFRFSAKQLHDSRKCVDEVNDTLFDIQIANTLKHQ